MSKSLESSSPLDHLFKNVIIVLFHLLIFITPFIWTASNSELFEFPKMFFTYALTLLISGFWLGRMIINKRLILNRGFFALPLVLFLGSQLIATAFSIHPHTSIFGYYSRLNGGLLSLISYSLLYFSLLSNFNSKQARQLLFTLVLTTLITSLYSFFEHFGFSPSCYLINKEFSANCWVQDVQFRVFGTFGQPNWQAAYIITSIFLPLSFWANQKTQKPGLSFFEYLITIFSTAFLFSVLIFTKSRSGLLGFGIGLIVYLFLNLLVYHRLHHQKVNIAIPLKLFLTKFALTTSVLALVFFTFGRGIHPQIDRLFNIKQTQNTSESSKPDKLSQTSPSSIGGTDSSDIRLIVWRGALELVKKYPIFGSGVETFAYSYYQTRPREHNDVSEWDFLYNKAHNEFLNFASTTGIVGLICYLLLILTYCWWTLHQVWHLKKEVNTSTSNSQNSISIIIALLAGFIALNVSNFFGFSTVSVNLLFYMFPALSSLIASTNIDSITHKSPKELNSKPTLIYPDTTTPSLILVGIAIFYLLFILNRHYTADKYYARGLSALELGDLPNAISSLEKASNSVPSQPNYAEQLSLAYAQAALQLNEVKESTTAALFSQQAIIQSDKSLSHNPHHLNYYKTRARVFITLSNIDPKYAQVAKQSLIAGTSIAPTDAKIFYNLGLIHEQLSESDEAISAFKQAILLKPNYEAARFDLAKLYESTNQPDLAAIEYRYILDHINPEQPLVIEGLNRVTKTP